MKEKRGRPFRNNASANRMAWRHCDTSQATGSPKTENAVDFLAGVWRRGITENCSDLNMAIPPSGVTEDKVHGQLCDPSTCQWNKIHPSCCKTQCIVVFMQSNWHSWSQRKEKQDNLRSRRERVKAGGATETRQEDVYLRYWLCLWWRKQKKQTLFWEKLKIIIVVAY